MYQFTFDMKLILFCSCHFSHIFVVSFLKKASNWIYLNYKIAKIKHGLFNLFTKMVIFVLPCLIFSVAVNRKPDQCRPHLPPSPPPPRKGIFCQRHAFSWRIVSFFLYCQHWHFVFSISDRTELLYVGIFCINRHRL